MSHQLESLSLVRLLLSGVRLLSDMTTASADAHRFPHSRIHCNYFLTLSPHPDSFIAPDHNAFPSTNALTQ